MSDKISKMHKNSSPLSNSLKVLKVENNFVMFKSLECFQSFHELPIWKILIKFANVKIPIYD